MTSTPSLKRAALAVAVSAALLAPAGAYAASASLASVGTSVTMTHDPGSPTGTSTGPQALAIQGSSPTVQYSATRTFTGGTTKGKAGVGNSEGTTVAKLVFPTGLGVDQTDTGHLQQFSQMTIVFTAIYDIVGSGSFGPSINAVFGVPFGATIAPGGSALFECDINWEAKVSGMNGNNFFTVRNDYTINSSLYTNGADNTGGRFDNNNAPGGANLSVLKTFTAPADSFAVPGGAIAANNFNQLKVSGFVKFSANNDNGPVNSVFPRDISDGTDPNDNDPNGPFAFFQPKDPEEELVLQLVPNVGFEVVPEPACGALFAMGMTLLLRRSRRDA